MGALSGILNSEKGLIGALLIVGVTVLAAFDKVSFGQWSDYTMAIFGIYVAGKTTQAAVSAIANAKVEAAKATPAESSAPVVSNTVVTPAAGGGE